MTPTAVFKTCRCYRASVLRTVHTDCQGRRLSCHYRKKIWSLSRLCSLSHPLRSSLHHTPLLEGFSTPLVMTMLQTALLNLGALPEPWCNLAKKKPWLKPAPEGGSGVFRRKLTMCGDRQPQGTPQPCLGSDTLPGKVLRWLGKDVDASGKRRRCRKTVHPSKSYMCTAVLSPYKTCEECSTVCQRFLLTLTVVNWPA